MSHKNLYRVALISAALSTLGWFAYIFASVGAPNLSAIDNPAQYYRTVQEIRASMLLYGWGGTIGALLTLPYILAFYQATKGAGSVRLVPVAAAFSGVLLTLTGFVSNSISELYFILPKALEASPETAAMMFTTFGVASDLFEGIWWIGSFLVYGLGVFWIALHAWRTTATPQWLSVVGLVGGLAGLTWLRHFIPFLQPFTIVMSLVNILGVSIWAIGLSAALLRRASALSLPTTLAASSG